MLETVQSILGNHGTFCFFLLETAFNLINKILIGNDQTIPGYNAYFFQLSIMAEGTTDTLHLCVISPATHNTSYSPRLEGLVTVKVEES